MNSQQEGLLQKMERKTGKKWIYHKRKRSPQIQQSPIEKSNKFELESFDYPLKSR